MPERPLCIYIDVDGTLVRTSGPKRIPNSELLHRLREWKDHGAILYCWSSFGAGYAERTAEQLQVKDCFAGFLTKPHALVDDQGMRQWAYFAELAPERAAQLSLNALRQTLEAL